jgi:VacB/RNase II family 3'-5' exoribonuclease
MEPHEQQHRTILSRIAHQAMLDRGLLPDFSAEVLKELNQIQGPAKLNGNEVRDLRQLLWASIDNEDSRDLDQLTAAEALADGKAKIYVSIADVDALVKKNSAIDGHASHNTTTVYTPGTIFPMLPEKLSTDLTSMNVNEDRLSVVIELVVDGEGVLTGSDVYRAVVRNKAQLDYNSVAAWLDGKQAIPQEISAIPGLEKAIRLQDAIAEKMMNYRHLQGALSLDTIEAKPRFDGEQISGLEIEEKNRAKQIIEDFMIAANGVVARFLVEKNFPSIRRVVRIPKRWDRIVELAAEHGSKLPIEPDSIALEKFLNQQKAAEPQTFPDLSLAVIKLLGAGEYTADLPGDNPPGHFGLAVKDYTHSTAPNRRYTDLITQRLVKAAIEKKPVPYTMDELVVLAKRCTAEENSVNKVERQVNKSAAALLLESRIGEQFEAIVTGAADKGTWVRLLSVPVEGKLVQGFEGLDVGHRLRVKLKAVNVEQGFIDFIKC